MHSARTLRTHKNTEEKSDNSARLVSEYILVSTGKYSYDVNVTPRQHHTSTGTRLSEQISDNTKALLQSHLNL